jgi:hypothetical protein
MNKMHHLRWSAAQVDSGEKTDAASDFTFIGIRKYFKEAASLRELSLLVQDLAEFSATLLNNSSAEGPEINQLIARAKVILGKDPITFTKWLLPLLGSCLASYQNPPANLLQEFQHILCSLESQNV